MAKKRQKLNIKEEVKKDTSLKKETITSGDSDRARKKLSDLRKEGKSNKGNKLNLFLNVLKPMADKRKSSSSLLK